MFTVLSSMVFSPARVLPDRFFPFFFVGREKGSGDIASSSSRKFQIVYNMMRYNHLYLQMNFASWLNDCELYEEYGFNFIFDMHM